MNNCGHTYHILSQYNKTSYRTTNILNNKGTWKYQYNPRCMGRRWADLNFIFC